MTTPVTQRDVAAACKVHPSTICLALNNSPSIPLATRQRIRAMANELGYQPNAAARNLAFMRNEKPVNASMPLAWINQEKTPDFWRKNQSGLKYWEAARERAVELGYHLEEFSLHESGMTAGRLAQIIHARGIQGVVFPVMNSLNPDMFQPAWSRFSCLSFNDYRSADWVDVVCPDYYCNADRVILELSQRGFTRIGLVLDQQFEEATRGMVSSCYLRYADTRSRNSRLPACLLKNDANAGCATLDAWCRQHRPDVVICRDRSLQATFEKLGHEVCVVQLGEAEEGVSAGINELPGAVAMAAIERLAEKIRRNERGMGTSTQCHLIKGHWCDAPLTLMEAQAVA
jgi:DNA-binding LacI/PurR family transcriptional regulator